MNYTGGSLAVFNENENVSQYTTRGGKAGLGGVQSKRGLQDITNATQQSKQVLGKKQQTSLPPANTRVPSVTARRSLQPTSSASSGMAHNTGFGHSAAIDVDMAGMAIADPVKDIDQADVGNPQCVTEYVGDIMQHLRATETKWLPSPDYMHAQTDINEKMRAILIDWLIDVHLKFKLVPETMNLTVNIIDRFLSAKHVARKKLQLVGVTAMLIASKYEEIYAPEVKDFVYISDKAYSRDEILKMESLMLNTLSFNLTVPSSLQFVGRFAKASGFAKDESKESQKFIGLANYIAELMLQEYFMIKYLPSMVAASATYLAIKIMNKDRGVWSATMHRYTQYSEAALANCSNDLYGLVKAARSSALGAVKKKYSQPKFQEVGKMPIDGV